MRTLLVVERDPFPNAGLGLASGLERMQINAFVFERPPQPLDHDVVHPPPLAVHRDLGAGFLENLGKLQGGELAPLVRVEDPGRPEPGQRLPKGRHAKIRLQRVRQPPGEDLSAVPVHDRHEIEKPPAHRDVADVRAPDLVRMVDRHPFQQIRVDLVTGKRLAGVGFLVDRTQPHLPHPPGDPLAADAPSTPTEPPCHLPGSEEGGLQELPVDDPHEIEVERGFSDRLVVERGAADSQKKALPGDAELGMGRFDHPFPPVSAQRPKALDKKSRSTVSSPILACNSFTRASWSPSWRACFPENSSTSPSAACRFHFVIRFEWTPNREDNSESVASSRIAAIATLALNSAVYRFRLLVFMPGLLRQSFFHLTRLSENPVPP